MALAVDRKREREREGKRKQPPSSPVNFSIITMSCCYTSFIHHFLPSLSCCWLRPMMTVGAPCPTLKSDSVIVVDIMLIFFLLLPQFSFVERPTRGGKDDVESFMEEKWKRAFWITRTNTAVTRQVRIVDNSMKLDSVPGYLYGFSSKTNICDSSAPLSYICSVRMRPGFPIRQSRDSCVLECETKEI